MAWMRRKSGPKSAKNQPFCPRFCNFSFPLSPRHFSHQLEPPPTSPPPTEGVSASPRTQILTGDKGSHREVFPLPFADFRLLLLLLSSSATGSQHCHHFFHQHLRQLHVRPVTVAPSPPQGCLPFHSAVYNCKVACRTQTYCSRSANNSFAIGPGQFWPSLIGWVWLGPKKKKIFWVEIGPTVLGRYRPIVFWVYAWPSYLGRLSPHVFNNIYIYISFKKNSKKFQKSLKKIMIFSNIFLPNLYNIGLYIYTIKYKSGIKIPGFLRDISKKKFQNIFKKKIIFMHTAKS